MVVGVVETITITRDSVQVGKAVFVKESYTTLGIEPRTYSYPGRISYHNCVSWVKKTCGHSPLYPSKVGFPWLSTIRWRADTILQPLGKPRTRRTYPPGPKTLPHNLHSINP